jgi:DNA-binding MarR family transcriptional regulator
VDPSFPEALEAAKRASTAQLLFKCARLVNERALATVPTAEGEARPRPAHMALFPHIALEGTRQSELARKLGVSKQAVGQLVGELEAMGVVERQPDPDDGRAKRVVFTERGLRSILDGLAHLRRVEAELAEAIGEDTMASLRAALLSLHDHLDEG